METGDVLIIGGGASGFFCGCELLLLNPNLKVHIWEKSQKTLSKVRISGGGRCNVTHHLIEPRYLIKKYPRGQKYLKSKFNKFGVADTISWFNQKGVDLKVESDGRMFPVSNSSESIIETLEHTFFNHGGILKKNTTLESMEVFEHGLKVRDSQQNLSSFNYLVFAIGGLTSVQSQWVSKITGAHSTDLAPSIFTFNINDKSLHDLAGLSVPIGKVRFEGVSKEYYGPILITHWGLSGPAVLASSAWHATDLKKANYKVAVLISWIEEKNEDVVRNALIELLRHNPQKNIANTVGFDLPKRLWHWLLERSKIKPETTCIQLKKDEINRLVENLLRTKFHTIGKTTFKEEFVTAGGIDLSQLNEDGSLRKNDRIYFIGEMLDIDGVTGGFNFQAAWTTAHVSACAISEKLNQS